MLGTVHPTSKELLLACGEDLNLYSFLGIILLIGIVKKNAIMIVDFALDAERNCGLTPEAAVYQGCLQRFRPINDDHDGRASWRPADRIR